MRRSVFSAILLGAASVLASCATPAERDGSEVRAKASASPEMAMAKARLANVNGADVGSVTITQMSDGLQLELVVNGLPAGQHGVHIHQTGDCSAADFSSAGGHWNPLGSEHGLQNPKGAHKGDFPNLDIAANGSGRLTAVIAQARLDGDIGLFDADGAAFVIHAGMDDQITDPSGDSGARIACGVFAAG